MEFKKQHQDQQPGIEHIMNPIPQTEPIFQKGEPKLKNRVAIITGGDSGIGKAVVRLFAREGANIVLVYLNEHDDAKNTKDLVEQEGAKCHLLSGDVGDSAFAEKVVEETIKHFGKIDIIVNNAGEQHSVSGIEEITDKQLKKTFRTNIFSQFYLVRAALSHLKKGAAIINNASVTAYRGSKHLLDYSSTKGAIVSFTRSLALNLAEKRIRVNGVAPGPIWTPLIPASYPAEAVPKFGQKVPLGRAGQPNEVAPSFLFLASEDSRYMTGQILHPNGGEIING
jgi:NAD(P)-dependent dehydrogenase (short-subunit alcohol dehydrogenase family)